MDVITIFILVVFFPLVLGALNPPPPPKSKEQLDREREIFKAILKEAANFFGTSNADEPKKQNTSGTGLIVKRTIALSYEKTIEMANNSIQPSILERKHKMYRGLELYPKPKKQAHYKIHQY